MSAGLFRPEEFRDNCGFGLIAHTAGDASHRLLQTAIESLTCMTHRGGIAADGKTGDGCGLLLQMPDQFMRTLAREQFGLVMPGEIGYVVVTPPWEDDLPDPGDPSGEEQPASRPWWQGIWDFLTGRDLAGDG
mgnify:CR=1 FL=1